MHILLILLAGLVLLGLLSLLEHLVYVNRFGANTFWPFGADEDE